MPSAITGKDINLATTVDELDAAIESLNKMVEPLKESLTAAVKTGAAWKLRAGKAERLLVQNDAGKIPTAAHREALEDLLRRAQTFARASEDNADELRKEIESCEGYIEAAKEAKAKLAILESKHELNAFPWHELEVIAKKPSTSPSREIRSAIAIAEALISLREGK